MIVKKQVTTTVNTTVRWNKNGFCDSGCSGFSEDSVWCSVFDDRCTGTCDGLIPVPKCRSAVYKKALENESEETP